MDLRSMQILAEMAGRPNQIIIADEFFAYSTGRLPALAAGAATIASIQIQADSDFLVEKMTYDCDVAGAARTNDSSPVPNVSVSLLATGSGRQLFNTQVPIPTIFGRGVLPFIVPQRYLLPASSVFQINLTSYEAVNSDILTLVFAGRKLYWGFPPKQ